MDDRAARLRQARLAAGFETAAAAAEAHGWNRNTYASNENGNAPYSWRRSREYAAAFGVRPEWLYDAQSPQTGPQTGSLSGSLSGSQTGPAPIIGRVGADPGGEVLLAGGQAPPEFAPLPPGGTERAVALRVTGHSMRGLADDGALIYFEDQRTPPSPDMLGQVVVVELETGEVLVKRLLRGAAPGRYDLESVAGPTRRDARLRWAAHITAIVPPWQARRILIQGD